MSVELYRSLLLGTPVRKSSSDKNGSATDLTTIKKLAFQSPFSFLNAGRGRRQQKRPDQSQFGGQNSFFSLKNFDSENSFKVKCTEETFPKTKALIRSFIPLWKEGLFLIRCSVFFAVISAAGMLVWYAQLKATNFVETQLLPSVCSILSEHLQRDLAFGKVRRISPLGITLSSCSIGPHGKEFSCGEVETMKLRIRPFSSLRRGKIVIDAILFQPCVLVAQKEDFSWLGIPPPSEDSPQRHHSTEEGIDYRTKTRRLAREESAVSWDRKRVKAAIEAANMGYTVPSGDSASFLDEELQGDSHFSTKSGQSGSFYCMDEEMHLKDHHCIDSNIKYSLKHADLEKSFGTRRAGTGLHYWSKMIPHFLWHKFRRKDKQKVLSKGSLSSKQRILQHSATAALAYFRGPGKFREPFSSQEAHTSDGSCEDKGNSDVMPDDIIHETRSGNIVELVQLNSKELKSELFPQNADGILNTKESSDALSYGMPKDGNDENHIDTGSSHLDRSLITSSEVSHLGIKSEAENNNHSMNYHDNSIDSYISQEAIPERPNGGDRGEVNLRVLQMDQKSFWSMSSKYWKILFPFAVNEVLSVRLADEIEKLKSSLSIKAEDLSAELVDDLNENGYEGIEKVLPITLDSVYFSGGTLMLLGYGDQEPREMVKVDGHVRFENHYKRIHVKLGGNCMEWGQEHTSQGGGQLAADVFVDIHEQNWHANLNVVNLFAPLFERILEIPITLPKGRATGEVHICMSKGDSFPSLHGQIDVTGLSLFILDAPAAFSELTASLCFRGQRIFLHNASGWFGDAPVEASGDFGINPEDGEFHLMCQIPCVEVNALMRTLKMRPLLFPLAGSVTAVFNCQGPLDAPVFVGSGIISRKTSQTISSLPPSAASEAVIENKEAGAVAAFDRIPFSHVSANFTFNLDNCVADLYGIRACLIDGGEIRGAGSAWICPEGEIDETAMDVNLSGTFLLDKVLRRYLGKGVQMTQAKIGELNGETRLSGSLLRPRFDIKWAAPKAEESFGDARGEIIICHDYITVNSSSVAFDLYTKVQTSYRDDYGVHKSTINDTGIIPLIVEGVDLDLRMRGFELTSLISSDSLDSPRTIHLKATGKIKFQGKVIKNSKIIDDSMSMSEHKNSTTEKQYADDIGARLVGDVSLSGIRLNQFMLAPQLTGSVSVSRDFVKLSATGRPDENLAVEIVGPLLFAKQEILQNRRLLSISLQKGQLRANIFYEPHTSTNLEVRNFPLDELELASLRGTIQRGELQLNFQKRRGHGMLLVFRPKFSGVLGEALDVAGRWSGDVITIEKSVLEQASSKYELQGEYVLPGTRDRYPVGKEKDGSVKQGMAGHLGNVISSMGRWRMRLEVPGAELAEMLPLARLLSRSTDPAVQSRSKDLFMQSLQSAGFYSESLHDQLKAIQNQLDFLDDNILEDIYLPGLAEFRGRWNGSLNASGGGNGDTMADFNFLGEDWEWGNYKTQRVMVDGAYSNRDGLRLEKLFIQKDNATLHADGTVLGPITNLHFAVLNFPVGLVPTLVQIIESSTSDSIHSLRQWLTPLKGILHMEGDLRGSLAKPECDIQLRLLDGSVGGVDLGRAEVVASLTPSSRFLFNANFEPIVQSGHVHIQGSIPVTYVQHDLIEDTDKQLIVSGSVIQIPVWVKEIERGGQDMAEKKVRDKNEEGWDFQLAESLKGLNWNLLDEGEVRMNADIKDGGMTLITALCPYANWLNGYADILLQVSGTIDQPVLDGSATFHRASVSSPVFRKPLTNLGGTVNVNSNRLCISSIESRVSRKGKILLKGNLPLKSSESSANDKLDLKCEVLEVRAKNIFSGQVDSQMQISGSILQPNISGMTQLSHGEAYLPHDKGNGNGANRLISSHSVFPSADYNRWTATEHASSSFGSLTTSSDNKWPQPAGKQTEADKKMEDISKPGVDVRLNDLKLILGPELRIVYPLILNFAVSGEVELDGMAHPKCIRPKGTLTFENGDVNLVATQVRLKRDHLNVAKFEPDFGLDPILDLTLVGSEWQFRIQSRASTWQDNLVVTSARSVDQDVLTPTEAARVFESQLAESLLEGDGQLAFKKLATTTLEKLMPRIEGKGEFGQARWRLVYAPQIPSLLSVDPTIDPLKSLANNISFGTEVEVQLGKRLQASVVRQMKDSEMAMQWTFIYQLTNRLRVLFQSTPSNRLLFEYSAISQN